MLQEPKEVESPSVRSREIHENHVRGDFGHPGDEVQGAHLHVGEVGGGGPKPTLVEGLL